MLCQSLSFGWSRLDNDRPLIVFDFEVCVGTPGLCIRRRPQPCGTHALLPFLMQ